MDGEGEERGARRVVAEMREGMSPYNVYILIQPKVPPALGSWGRTAFTSAGWWRRPRRTFHRL